MEDTKKKILVTLAIGFPDQTWKEECLELKLEDLDAPMAEDGHIRNYACKRMTDFLNTMEIPVSFVHFLHFEEVE